MVSNMTVTAAIITYAISGTVPIAATHEPWLHEGLMFLCLATGIGILILHVICRIRWRENCLGLKRREEQLSLAFRAIGEGLWDCEISTGKDYFSDEWLSLLGYEPGELEEHKNTWKSIVHPDDLSRVLEDVHRHMRGETSYYQSEHRCRTKTGSWIWVLDRGKVVEWDAEGNPVRMIGTHQDITPRKIAEQSLEESEQRYRTIVENINEGMIKQTLEGIILEINDYFCFMTGYSREELLGEPVSMLSTGGNDGGMAERCNEILEKKTFLHRWKLVKKDATVIHTSVNSSLVEYNNNSHIQSFLRDITMRVIMEEKLLRTSELAEKANRAKGEFLANMSHEIRTPMNAILGFTELTLDTELMDEQRENLNAVMESSNDLLVIINDILDFSKIEAGRLDLVPRKLNLYRSVQDVIEMVKQTAAEKELTFQLHIDSSAPEYIVADPVRLRQVLINLLNNAVKFTPTGSVEICAELHRQDSIIGGLASPAPAPRKYTRYEQTVIQFSVKDTGIGISEELLSEIFNYFTQADGSAARRYGGTGLGLSISRKLVELMGGKIWVESTPGTGSTFYFTIEAGVPKPVQAVEAYQHMSEDEYEQYRRHVHDKPLKILLADDKPTNLLITTRLLEKEGHLLVSVPDGSEALTAHERETFDCILMDVQMPVMNGFQSTRQIRKREQHTGMHVPVIAMTAHAMTGDREKCISEGMDDYIAKPVRIAELRGLLMKWGYGK